MRFNLRKMTIAMAVVALAMAGLIKLSAELKYWTLLNGWNTSVFPIGQEVTILGNASFHDVPIANGTQGIVTSDPPDDDSAYSDRLVGVMITDGTHRGTRQGIERKYLRAR